MHLCAFHTNAHAHTQRKHNSSIITFFWDEQFSITTHTEFFPPSQAYTTDESKCRVEQTIKGCVHNFLLLMADFECGISWQTCAQNKTRCATYFGPAMLRVVFFFSSVVEKCYFETQKREHMFMGVLFRKSDMLEEYVCQFYHGFLPHVGGWQL